MREAARRGLPAARGLSLSHPRHAGVARPDGVDPHGSMGPRAAERPTGAADLRPDVGRPARRATAREKISPLPAICGPRRNGRAHGRIRRISAAAVGLSYKNPVWPGYFADPFVLRWRGAYFAYGTGATAGRAKAETPCVFEVLHSPDLVQWESLGAALVPAA